MRIIYMNMKPLRVKIFRELKGLPDPDEEKKEEEDQKEENGNDV